MAFIDSHAHLEVLPDIDRALERAKEAGVNRIITIGTDLESSKHAANLALSCSRPGLDIYVTVGIHPRDGKADVEKFGIERCISELRRIAMSEKVVGVGEAGLDYFATTENTESTRKATADEERDYQRPLFKAQIELASELQLPIVVHCRNGWEEIFDLLTFGKTTYSSSEAKRSREVSSKNKILNQVQDDAGKFGKFSTSLPREHSRGSNNNLRGAFHSFTGGPEEAKKAVELGFYVSFSGIVTFKNAVNIQEAARLIPTDRILIETDSPYLAPEPIRGSQNEPGNVKLIGQFLDKHLELRQGTIEEQSEANARRLFGI